MNEFHDIPLHLFEKLEAYALRKMSAEETLDFEALLAKDPDLVRQLEFVRAATEMVQQESLRADMQEWHKTLPRKNAISGLQGLWWSLAAGFALLLGLGWWYTEQSGSGMAAELYNSHYFSDPGLPVPMSAAAELQYQFYDAMVDYKSGKYQLSIQKWTALEVDDTASDTLRYYLGAAHMEQQNFALAEQYFTEVLRDGTSPFADKARLYRALCWVKLDKAEHIIHMDIPEQVAYRDALIEIRKQYSSQ